QEAVLSMTERIDSLLQFGSSGRNNPLVHERVSLVVEKAVSAVKFHPDSRNVSITVAHPILNTSDAGRVCCVR
ncbi:MAG TPA: hypothetical protein VFE08_06360, partial [Candidatus Sulfotelmatobacter sp.]|nr:hypothetical protein [Candidatus Sulfotelmatobacter sp.]